MSDGSTGGLWFFLICGMGWLGYEDHRQKNQIEDLRLRFGNCAMQLNDLRSEHEAKLDRMDSEQSGIDDKVTDLESRMDDAEADLDLGQSMPRHRHVSPRHR